MTNQDNKNFVNNVVDAQKQAVDTMVENAKQFTNGNTIVNETVQKGSEWYKNWLDNQKNVFAQTTDKTTGMNQNIQDNMSKMTEFYQNWFNMQTSAAKQMWEMNSSLFQNAANTAGNTAQNPMSMFNNMTGNWNNMFSNMNNNWNNMFNNMNQANNWMNMMNQWNSLFNQDALKNASENWTASFNQYSEMLKNNFSKWQESMQNGTTQDAYKNMINAAEGFTRFHEIWAPMWKSITEKSFNMDVYKQWMDPAKYKTLLDQYFGFMPAENRQYFEQMSNMMQDGMKQAGNMGMQQFQQMRSMMNNMMPAVNPSEIFGGMLSGYNNAYNMMNEAYAPFTTMMTPNQHTKNLTEWQELANRAAVYNIKNAELQYMMYAQGAKVMDNLAENVMQKIQSGEEINSLMGLYQEWMNIGDKTFVSLFESDEYSKLMAEVSAMQLRLRKDMENQMEKFMTGIPVATRSEMDEMYKTIYDLKKQVRQMEKMMDLNTEEETTEEEVKTTASSRRTKKA